MALLAVIAVANVYRAATLSIVCDEAFTWAGFLSQPVEKLITTFDAGHHVLHTYLCRISLALFGLSEFAIRIPSLLGGFLYLTAVYRICRRVFQRSRLFLLAVACLTLSPYIQDYMSMARGYGLALALTFLGIDFLIRALQGEGRAFAPAGVCFGLSVAANLTFATPNAALSLAAAALLPRHRFTEWLDHFAIPGIVSAFVPLVLPLSHVEKDSFYVGAKTLFESLQSLTLAWLVPNWDGMTLLPWSAFDLVAATALPGLLLIILVAAVGELRSSSGRPVTASGLLLSITGCGMALCVALLIAAHYFAGLLYPINRTALYLVPILTLAGLAAIDRARFSFAAAGVVLAALCATQYAIQSKTSHYSDARPHAGTERMVQVIRDRRRGDSGKMFRAAVDWTLLPGMKFYKAKYRMDWFEPEDRREIKGPVDYAALIPPEAAAAKELGFQTVYRDSISEAVLAIPAPQETPRAVAAPASNLAAYRTALPGYRYEFPRDHFEHPEFRTEWWYYTGNLRAEDGGRFGFELVFFRQAQRRGPSDNRSVWRADDLYLAHLALTEVEGKRFVYQARLNRAGPGVAGASFAERRIWNGNWSAQWDGERQTLHAVADEFRFDLRLSSSKPPVIHGIGGISRKAEGEGRASHYVSFTRLAAEGTLSAGKSTYRVEGTAWMDHEWFTHQLDDAQTGWDWFSLQFENKTELMLFQLRRKDGTIEPLSAGTFVDRQGGSKHLARSEFSLEPIAFWTSPNTKARYPIRWRVRAPAAGFDGECGAVVTEQELALGGTNYWEGAVACQGAGVGYLEMTGYDKPIRLN